MSTKKSNRRHRNADSAASIAATVREWENARARLIPVIGEGGFRILFARSLHLTRAEHPWLARVATGSAEPFADLQASLQAETHAHARLGSQALFATFTRLLHGLIGNALTTRLLAGGDPGKTRKP